MPQKLAIGAGLALVAFPSIVAASPVATPMPLASAFVLVQAQPEPSGVHTAIEWVKERLSEIDATLAALEEDASKRSGDAKKQADEAVQRLRTTRDAYRAKLDEALAEGQQRADAALAKARAELDARWEAFERDLDAYLSTINSEIAVRKAAFDARRKAAELYWQRTIADLEAQAKSALSPERRAAIETRIAELQAAEDKAKQRLAKLEQARHEAWSALREGLAEARQTFDKTHDKVRAAIERSKQ
jgi:deoxyribodipyrimidine photolyase